MRKRLWLGSAVAGLALVASACGSSSTSSAPTTVSSSVTTASNGGTTPSSQPPIKIAYMGILSGAYATPGSDNGFKLAISQINAAGGINGRQVEYKEFDTNITPQGGATATALALQYKPDVVIGYGVSAGLAASAQALNSAGVVVISNTLDQIASDKNLGSNLYFRMSLTTSQFATAADDYLFQSQGVNKLMVINTEDAAPSDGANYILADAKSRNVSTQHQAVAVTATDLTQQVLAAKSFGAGAIWEWGYPTTDGLLIKTAAANGYTGDIMTFSAESAAAGGLIPKSLLTSHILSVPVNCAPEVLTTPGAQAYDSAYTAKYGTAPTSAVANEDYDAVEMYKLAVEKAGSTSAQAVATALATVSFDGACGTDQSDSFHNLEHSISLLNFPNSTEALAQEVTNVSAQW